MRGKKKGVVTQFQCIYTGENNQKKKKRRLKMVSKNISIKVTIGTKCKFF